MNRRDVSFTFLHRVDEVEQNVTDGRWQSALALALTLPDICGGIAFPDMVKKYKDGRVMLDRQKNPTRDVGSQYVSWFDQYAAPYFKLSPTDEDPYICGQRCWQLRCEYLHQNKGFYNDESEDAVRFHLGVNCGTSVCQLDPSVQQADPFNIRIDIEQFCLRMCTAAKKYYEAAHTEKDFSLYNTPVLDFVQTVLGSLPSQKVLIMGKNSSYCQGLLSILKSMTADAHIFDTAQEARSHLTAGDGARGKTATAGGRTQKPALWIVTEDITTQADQPWRADKTTPVILLTKNPKDSAGIVKDEGKLIVLSMPVDLDSLRNAIKKFL